MIQMQVVLNAQNEATNQKRMEEQAASFQAKLDLLTSAAQQSYDSSHVAISTLKAKLEATTASEEETRRIAQKYIGDQDNIMSDKVAWTEKCFEEQQKKEKEYEKRY